MKGYQAVRSASGNPEVQRQADSNIRDAQRSISYLEESLQNLMNRRASSVNSQASTQSGSTLYGGSSSSPVGGPPQSYDSSNSSASLQAGRRQPPSFDSAPQQYPNDASQAYRTPAQYPSAPNTPAYGPPPGGRSGTPGAPAFNSGSGGTQDWQPAINRTGTTAKKTLTNLGE